MTAFLNTLHNLTDETVNKALHEIDAKQDDNFDWKDITQRVRTNDVDFIKTLIVNGEIDVNRQDNDHEKTMLMYAAEFGSYTIAELLCHYGANIDLRCRLMADALGYARRNGNYHISELLIFYKLGGSIGTQIKSILAVMQQQDGFIKYSLQHMSKQQLNDIVQFTIKNIRDMTPFSDDLLNLSWAHVNDINSKLFQTLMQTYESIIKDTQNKCGWSYLKQYFMKSTLWLRPYPVSSDKKEDDRDTIKDPNGHNLMKLIANDQDVLYIICNDCGYNLEIDEAVYHCRECDFYCCHICHPQRLKMMKKTDVDYSKTLYNELYTRIIDETEMTANRDLAFLQNIANKDANLWKQMTTFNLIPSVTARQDCITNGMRAKYTKRILIKDKSSIGFNPIAHYNANIYLNEMVLKANQIDQEFQTDMQLIIHNINAVSDMKAVGALSYRRGPVKQQQRAKTKVEVDYAKENFPNAAMLLDLNRCTINCKSISSMMTGLQLFVKAVEAKKSCVVGISRCKNGWTDFKFSNPGYTDIKFNVIISSTTHGSLIGEVQFLLDLMANYKVKAHSLYSIQRHSEFVDNMKQIMPISLNLEQQLFTLANYGDHKGLLHYIITNNLMHDTAQLLSPNFKKQTILTSMCRFDCIKAFRIMMQLCDKKSFDDMLHMCDDSGHTPIGHALEANSIQILQLLMQLYTKSVVNYFKEILQNADNYDNPDNQGVFYYSCRNNNTPLTKWAVANTVYNDKRFTCLMEYCKYNHLHVIKSLLSREILGDDANYMDHICRELDATDAKESSAIHYAASNKGWNIIEFVLDLLENDDKGNSLKFKYLNKKNKDGDTPFKIMCSYSGFNVALLQSVTNGLDSKQIYELAVNENKKGDACIYTAAASKVIEYLFDAIAVCNKKDFIKILNKCFMSACDTIAISHKKCQCVINIYKQYDVNVSDIILNERDSDNKTILMYACNRSGSKQINTVNLLFDNIETDNENLLRYIYTEDNNGMNALCYAFRACFVEVGARLISKIKEMSNEENESKDEDLMDRIVFKTDKNGWNLFHFACWNQVKHMKFICEELYTKEEEKVKKIVTTFNKPTNITALMVCCTRKRTANVKYLLDQFGDDFQSKLKYIDMKDTSDKTAIDIVNENNNSKLLKILNEERTKCLSQIN